MDTYKIIEVKESVFADNDREAARVRQALKQKGTFLLNLMSSPGSGKTTTLLRTIEALKDERRVRLLHRLPGPAGDRHGRSGPGGAGKCGEPGVSGGV